MSSRRSELGSSLIQVIVAVALLGIVTLGFASMISQMSNAQRLVQSRQDLSILADEIQVMFSNPTACRSGLPPGLTFDGAKAAVRFPPPTGEPPFQFDGMPFSYQLNARETLRSGQDLQNYALRTNRIQLVNADNMGPDSTGRTVYRAKIIGHFSPRGITSGLTDFNTKILASGYFTVDTSQQIVGCSDTSPTDLNQLASTCQALGGSFNTDNNRCAMPTNLADLCPQLNGTLKDGKCEITAASGAGGGTGSGTTRSLWSQTGQQVHISQLGNFTRCPASASTGQSCSSPGLTCAIVTAGFTVYHPILQCTAH